MENIDIKIIGPGEYEDVLKDKKITKMCLADACKTCGEMFLGVSPKFKLILCYSRKSYDETKGWKTKVWEVGRSNKRSITIFAPSVFKKLTDNQMSFRQVIMHEVNHVFCKNFVAHAPLWLVEGVACMVDDSEKSYHWKGAPKLDHLYLSVNYMNRHVKRDVDILEFYRSAYLTTKKIIRIIGISGLIGLLKAYAKNPKKNHKKLFSAYLSV